MAKKCLMATFGLILLLIWIIIPASMQSFAEELLGDEPASSPKTVKTIGPVLSSNLKRGCEPAFSTSFNGVGIAEGTMAVDFSLIDTKGSKVSLSGLLSEKPVVMVLGSFT
jgi:hypothetical protein